LALECDGKTELGSLIICLQIEKSSLQ
jgi:hypothetical protein